MTHIEDVLLWAVSQEGDRYVWGGKGDPLDPNPDGFDCSGLVTWACERVGVPMSNGAYWQYKLCEQHGTLVPLDEALATRGALLFVLHRDPPHGFDDVPHVAISLGDGTTVEARGKKWGVGTWASTGRFQAGGLVPDVDYTAGVPQLPPTVPHGGLVEARWFPRASASDGPPDAVFSYGDPGDVPIVGDWDGDGVDGIGVVRGTAFYLRNAPGSGFSDIQFTYGNLGDVPIVGDWNGDGKDGIGVHRGNTFHLRDELSSGNADATVQFGDPGDVPLVGRWKAGERKDSVGVHRGNMIHLLGDVSFQYGDPGDRIVMGDWNGDGIDTPAAVRAGKFYVRDSNTSGPADRTFGYGNPGDAALAGRWVASAGVGILVAR